MKMPYRKQTIYLETSIISAYFDLKKQNLKRKRITQEFWKKTLPKYSVVISDVVFAELEDTKDANYRIRFLEFVRLFKRLNSTTKISNLSQKYIKTGVMPKNKIADATHLALAVINKIDYLASWNQKHITSPQQRQKIFTLHKKLKLHLPIIATPDDFLE